MSSIFFYTKSSLSLPPKNDTQNQWRSAYNSQVVASSSTCHAQTNDVIFQLRSFQLLTCDSLLPPKQMAQTSQQKCNGFIQLTHLSIYLSIYPFSKMQVSQGWTNGPVIKPGLWIVDCFTKFHTTNAFSTPTTELQTQPFSGPRWRENICPWFILKYYEETKIWCNHNNHELQQRYWNVKRTSRINIWNQNQLLIVYSNPFPSG